MKTEKEVQDMKKKFLDMQETHSLRMDGIPFSSGCHDCVEMNDIITTLEWVLGEIKDDEL